MLYDVFISHSTLDKHVADAVCATLENSGIRCWIAPRDIIPGNDWASSITAAIKACRIMVLVFSENANQSSQVSKELNLAVSHNMMIIPFKIDNASPSGNMEYFLADTHWLDAIDGDMQQQIQKLKNVIISILPHNLKDGDSAPTHDASAGPQPTVQFRQIPQNKKEKRGLFSAYRSMWKNCFNFKGRTKRADYWTAVLINFIIEFIILVIDVSLDGYVFSIISSITLFIPTVSLGVRRLHDANQSAHWMWLLLTYYFSPVLVIFFCMKSVDDRNRFDVTAG